MRIPSGALRARPGSPIVGTVAKQRTAARDQRGAPRDPDHLAALGSLLEEAFPDPTQLFEHGLQLLVQQLGLAGAVITKLTDLGYEAFWWATGPGAGPDASIHEPAEGFAPLVLETPTRTLIIRDAFNDPQWREHTAFRRLGIRAYIGVPLHQSGRVIGVLSVHAGTPQPFTRAEIAMVNAMANLFSKTLEVEQLKHELHMTREALDLTSAVVEDSALESRDTHLPNLRYLDIWLKANLYLARRRNEPMVVAVWELAPTRESRRALRSVAEALRGEDLLVDQGRARFLLLLPRTAQEGGCILLERIRAKLGAIPMGATLWDPCYRPDRRDLAIQGAVRRAGEALASSREGAGEVAWKLAVYGPGDRADEEDPW